MNEYSVLYCKFPGPPFPSFTANRSNTCVSGYECVMRFRASQGTPWEASLCAVAGSKGPGFRTSSLQARESRHILECSRCKEQSGIWLIQCKRIILRPAITEPAPLYHPFLHSRLTSLMLCEPLSVFQLTKANIYKCSLFMGFSAWHNYVVLCFLPTWHAGCFPT